MADLLVGRGGEAAVLRELIGGLPERSAAVVVRGEAGIGKTVLVRSVLDERPAGDPRILRGACAPMSGSIAYSGLGATMTAALSRSAPPADFPSAAAARAWSIRTLTDVLDTDATQSTVLLVEDVHWADWSTLDFLAHLTRNLPERGLLVVLTWRDEATQQAERQTWLAELLRSPAVMDMPLRSLTARETAEQLNDLQPGCTAETVDAIYQRSAGNPYLNAELIRGDLTVPASLRKILLARLQTLSLPARTVVAATGTLARALDDDDLLAAVGGAANAVREACDSGLVIREPEVGCTPRHPVIAEVAYEQLLSSERRDLHARLAKHLASRVVTDSNAAQLAEVAEQYRRASDRDATFAWALAAAQMAEKAHAYSEAGHWYAVVCSLWRPSDLADERVAPHLVLAERAASLLDAAGRQPEALALLDDAVTDGDAELGMLEALLLRGKLHAHVDDLAAAMADIERARRLVPAGDERALGRVGVAHALILAHYARAPEVAQAAGAALEHATQAGDIRTVGQARGLLAGVAANEGRIDDALDQARAALAIARDLAEPEDLAWAGVHLTYAYGARVDTDNVVAIADSIQAELRQLMANVHWLEGWMESNAIACLYLVGRWDEALSRGDKARPASGPAAQDSQLAMIHMARGNLETAVEMQRGQESLAADNQPQDQADYAETEVELRLLQQRPRDALALALQAAELIHDTDEEPSAGVVLRIGLEAAVAAGSVDGFDRLVGLLGGAVSGMHAAGLAATVDGERSRMRGAPDPAPWLSAAQEWAVLGRPYWEAQARVRAAEALLARRGQAGNRGRATAELEAARGTAERLGAAPLLHRIQELAKVARIHLDDSVTEHHEQPAVDADPRSSLTERERQVLALVVDGRTNREIGAALYMSPKTASVHVTHILGKLGVQTRVQAAAEAVRLDLVRAPAPPS